ncbi:MAG: hypothetical protein AAGA85_13840 [Bacteroidota bacterium]
MLQKNLEDHPLKSSFKGLTNVVSTDFDANDLFALSSSASELIADFNFLKNDNLRKRTVHTNLLSVSIDRLPGRSAPCCPDRKGTVGGGDL